MAMYGKVNNLDVVAGEKDSSVINPAQLTPMFDNPLLKEGWRWLPITEVIVGVGGENRVLDSAVQSPIVEASVEIVRTSTWRDMTTQEINDRESAIIALEDEGANARALWLIYNAAYWLARNPHSAAMTLAQFKAGIENPVNQQISLQAFEDWRKELL